MAGKGKIDNLKSWKKGKSGNPEGRPKHADNRIIDIFKNNGIKKMSKAEALDIIAYIVSASESELEELLQNKDIPFLYTAVIRAVKKDASKGSLNAFDRLMDRFTGRPMQQIEQKINADVTVQPKIIIGKKPKDE